MDADTERAFGLLNTAISRWTLTPGNDLEVAGKMYKAFDKLHTLMKEN